MPPANSEESARAISEKGIKKDLAIWYTIMAFAPFWWRFWQCLHKTYKTKNYWQLVNAFKYVTKWFPTIALLGGASKHFIDEKGQFTHAYWWFFFGQMFTTLLCLYWDYVWDWGFFYGKKNRVLRDKLTF